MVLLAGNLFRDMPHERDRLLECVMHNGKKSQLGYHSRQARLAADSC